jgi:diguanylate cyclase (GGDEF)-like protein
MKVPSRPPDEGERRAALAALDVLDTPPEERFDRYTRLARRLFDVPVALVSLVDTDRQWFKSRQGLDATETPRDVSFCGHAILDDAVFVVEDAHADPRFSDNPLVTGDPRVRFYAGCPLAGPGGHRIGTLCIIDREPRSLGAADVEALRDIASMVASELSAIQLATIDQLTRISNRRGYELLARQALASCRRAQWPSAAVMIDMDGFKAINDELGHDEGDRALVEFAEVLVATFRETDVVARLGGDEFAVLLARATAFQAKEAVERLAGAVEARNARPDRRYRLAFSAGIAEHDPARHATIVDTLRDADARMYRNKRTKGDRTLTQRQRPLAEPADRRATSSARG